jgi:hypothetical protein
VVSPRPAMRPSRLPRAKCLPSSIATTNTTPTNWARSGVSPTRPMFYCSGTITSMKTARPKDACPLGIPPPSATRLPARRRHAAGRGPRQAVVAEGRRVPRGLLAARLGLMMEAAAPRGGALRLSRPEVRPLPRADHRCQSPPAHHLAATADVRLRLDGAGLPEAAAGDRSGPGCSGAVIAAVRHLRQSGAPQGSLHLRPDCGSSFPVSVKKTSSGCGRGRQARSPVTTCLYIEPYGRSQFSLAREPRRRSRSFLQKNLKNLRPVLRADLDL